jgi:Bacterial Ig-like domain (group 2)
MRVLRSSLFVAATAIIAAACGDKINLPTGNNTTTTTTTTTAKINSVLVAPNSATITVGQQVQLTAVVDADAGITPTVTWSTTSSASATVSQTGLVQGMLASPGVAICATASATGVASKANCATIVVQAISTVTPATVQITSITGANLNTPVAVPPASVAGQINVSVTANPGTTRIDSVVVYLNGKPAGTQTFTAAQAAALRSAGNQAVADQQVLAPLVFSINTAAFVAATGAVTYPNGITAVSAVAYGHQGSSGTTNTASQSVSLLLGNADAWVLKQTIGTSTVANNAAGYQFTTGSVAVSAIPVLYNSGLAIGTASVNFGTAACDLSGAVQRTLALTPPAAGAFAWTATFPFTASVKAGTAADAGTVNGYEYNSACASNAGGGEGITIAASQYTTTNTGPTGFAAGVTIPAVRLDNNAPVAPVVFINPNGRQSGWLNDFASFATINTGATSNGMITAAVVDNGVGGVTYVGRAGTTLALSIAAANISNPSTLAASLNNTSYCLTQYSIDALGNTSAAPAACATTFGVDRVAPTIAFSGGLASNARINTATVAAEFQVTVLDAGDPATPTLGVSGMLSGASVIGTVTLRNATSTAAATCIVGSWATATGCSPVSVNAAPGYPLVPTTVVAAVTLPGYLTYTAVSRDAAGNSSTSVTRVVVHDNAANPPAVTFFTPFLPGSLNAASASITAVASDDLDIRDFQWMFVYGATMAGLPIQTPQVVVNGYNATPLINTAFTASFSGSLMRQIQENGAAGTWTPGAAAVLSSANILVRDQGGSAGTTLVTAVPPGTVNFTTAASTFAVATASNWNVSNAATSVSDGSGTPVNALSVTLNADAEGATAVAFTAFSRVDFYALNAAGTQWVLIGTSSSPVVTDNGVLRRNRYSMSWTPGTTFGAAGVKSVRAVGVNAANDGFSTTTNTNITLTTP